METVAGKDAVCLFSDDFDLVVLDVMMPGMDGYEVARTIRRKNGMGDVPILMVTALFGDEARPSPGLGRF